MDGAIDVASAASMAPSMSLPSAQRRLLDDRRSG
jgi:hypothetical protein